MICPNDIKRVELIFYSTFLSCLMTCQSSGIQMRIVHETASYGYMGRGGGSMMDDKNNLVARSKPSNFSGPIHLKQLHGKCFNTISEGYQYILCPFENMTQYEISNRWNAYQGILGVWSHWNIENYTFTSMVFTLGDSCGTINRTVEVILHCGLKNLLSNVTEPNKCQYSAIFTTPLVCHKDALLVYPRLQVERRNQWDNLWTDYQHGLITFKGYKKSLKKMFYEIGLSLPLAIPVVQEPIEMLKHDRNAPSSAIFSDVRTCNKEYENLKKEITKLNEEMESLKLMLDLSKVQERLKKQLTS